MLNAVKEELLDYVSFVSYIKDKIRERMGDSYSVMTYKVLKNNSLELDSLVLLKEGRNFAPNIYLNGYYDLYLAGTSMKEIIDRLCMIYNHCSIPAIKDDFNFSLDTIGSYIFFRIVSLERNKKLLTQIPYIKYLDFAVTFHCLVRCEDDGIGTIRITNEHMKLWNISLNNLSDLAFKNTSRLFPPVIRTMEEVLRGSLDNGNPSYISCPMYILTNEKGINGASCLLYKDLIKNFAHQINSDLYILPSSVHEIILLPMKKKLNIDYLSKMVMEINKSSVPVDEILSDNVYIYSMERDAISM